MLEEISLPRLKKFLSSIDWILLLFLILFLNVKIYVKIAAIILIYCLRPDFRFGLRLPFGRGKGPSRLPLFYATIAIVAVADWVFYGLYADGAYNMTLTAGLLFWFLCLLAIHQVKLSIERSDTAVLHRTLMIFFVINAAVSLLMLLNIMMATGTLNPYLFQGGHQKYFISTGDYILGLSFDVSATNAFINAFGVAYYLYRKQSGMVLLCMSVMLLTGSNTTNLLLVVCLIAIFFFRSDRERKSLVVICLFMLILFTAKISPQNHNYALNTVGAMLLNKPFVVEKPDPYIAPIKDIPDSALSPERIRQKIATLYMDSVTYLSYLRKDSAYRRLGIVPPVIHPIPQANIHKREFQSRDDTTQIRIALLQFVRARNLDPQVDSAGRDAGKIPGKLVGFRQSAGFLKRHPEKWLTGNGLARFSSKLAFRSAALGIAGKYPTRFRYIDQDFRDLHLALYIYYFTKGPNFRSLINTPDSEYDRLLTEYGLAGLAFFVCFYMAFFIRDWKTLSYGIPMLFLMAGGFLIGYWFEQLSVVVLFECMMLLDKKEGGQRK
jgi:hypothetical protein